MNLRPTLDWMILVNYWDAKLSTLPVGVTGIVGEPSEVYMQPQADYVEKAQPTREEHWKYRQRWPHSHCCVTEPYGGESLFVTDLGLDKVFVYEVRRVASIVLFAFASSLCTRIQVARVCVLTEAESKSHHSL